MPNFPWEFENDEMILFWGGVFSNWFSSEFSVYGTKYSSVEQFMMAEKAKFFGDLDALDEIMATHNPRTQKAIGRRVQDFDANKWLDRCQSIVYPGIRAKFEQNSYLLEFLRESGDRIIAEASPYDKIWGIGLAPNDPLATDQKNWQGKNFLGKLIMQARKELLA